MKRGLLIATLGFAGGLAASVVGFRLHTVDADVPPAAERLFYSGALMDGAVPATGPRDIEVRFHGAATGSGNQICTSGLQSATPLVEGHFRVNVGAACVTALAATPNAFVEVVVGGVSLPPSTTPRPRVAAVPYAAQAASAVTLTSALPATQVSSGAGTAQTRLDGLEARLVAVEAGPSICGFLAADDGTQGGYPAMRSACQTACASSSAWLCTPPDAVRSIQRGVWPVVGAAEWFWVASGQFTFGPPGVRLLDCNGFTQSTAGDYGPVFYWDGTTRWEPSVELCTSSHRSLCCDVAP